MNERIDAVISIMLDIPNMSLRSESFLTDCCLGACNDGLINLSFKYEDGEMLITPELTEFGIEYSRLLKL